ncbi:hypothetical protein FSP39_020265 [Pinctada imbricata]|uniref:Uncharacterized protein n=1 Tax=Pinctada imbricata TaxID=66713 RepID=A0AA89BW88_PINIB|nr:hypothetical protein FSP39_020265 [Pinctada imbricata]
MTEQEFEIRFDQLNEINTSKQKATQALVERMIAHRKQLLITLQIVFEVIIDITHRPRYFVFLYLEEDVIMATTSPSRFHTLPLFLNRQKPKRNVFFEPTVHTLLERENMLDPFHLKDIGGNSCKCVFEYIAMNITDFWRLIDHEYLKERRLINGKAIKYVKYESLVKKFFQREILPLVFSMIFICVSWQLKFGFQKEISIDGMSITKSTVKVEEREVFQLFPSFIFEVRIFPNETVNIFPYGGINGIDMSNYFHRLGTFKDKAKNFKLRPYQLASDGFYALDNPGQTKCYSCGFEYSSWQTGDDPRKIHFQNSPNCPFIRHHMELLDGRKNNKENKILLEDRGLDLSENDQQQMQLSEAKKKIEVEEKVDNELVSSVNDEQDESSQVTPYQSGTISSIPSVDQYPSGIVHISRSQGTDGCMVEKRANVYNRRILRYQSEYNQRNDRSRFPRYAVLTVRISSFHGFPCYVSQSPRQLALAGFYYLGYGDGVQCYFCGGKLTNWEPGDDPFVEHAKWFPMCLFLRETKGQDFISLVEDTYRDEKSSNFDVNISEEDLDTLYDKSTDKITNRNHVHRQEHSDEIEIGTESTVSTLTSIYPGAIATSIDTVSSTMSCKPTRPMTAASSHVTDHSLTSLVGQMTQTSVTDNTEGKSEISSGIHNFISSKLYA